MTFGTCRKFIRSGQAVLLSIKFNQNVLLRFLIIGSHFLFCFLHGFISNFKAKKSAFDDIWYPELQHDEFVDCRKNRCINNARFSVQSGHRFLNVCLRLLACVSCCCCCCLHWRSAIVRDEKEVQIRRLQEQVSMLECSLTDAKQNLGTL